MADDDFDWEHFARQFQQEDALLRVVESIGKAQGHYYKALLEEGLSPMEAMKIVSITITQIGEFTRKTLPVLAQMFIDYHERHE